MNSLIKFAFILILCFSIAFIHSAAAFEQIETYTVADGLVGPIVPVIFQDSRGTIWLGSDTGGVSRFDGNTFVSYTASPDHFRGDASIWCSTRGTARTDAGNR